jgi:hypothetical protein
MISKTETESLVHTNIEKGIYGKTYTRVIKLFGIPIRKYEYTLEQEVIDEDSKKQIGFGNPGQSDSDYKGPTG